MGKSRRESTMKKLKNQRGGTCHRWGFRKPVSGCVKNGSIKTSLRSAPRQPQDWPMIGDSLSAFRYHLVGAGKPIEELGTFTITRVIEIKVCADSTCERVERGTPAPGPKQEIREEKELNLVAVECGFNDWPELVLRVMGRRYRIPAQGIRMMLIKWEGVA